MKSNTGIHIVRNPIVVFSISSQLRYGLVYIPEVVSKPKRPVQRLPETLA